MQPNLNSYLKYEEYIITNAVKNIPILITPDMMAFVGVSKTIKKTKHKNT